MKPKNMDLGIKPLSVLAILCFATATYADVTVNGLFTDHMVLQRDIPVSVYGKAEPKEKVIVTFSGQEKSAIADKDGGWSVKLAALKASTNSATPAMFKRNGLYYVLFDTTTCFGPGGSGAQVYTATKPLGPYTFRGNINRDEKGVPIIAAQQTYVAQLPTSRGPVWIWMGDRWGSRPDGVKGHDFQYWSRPLVFNEDGTIQKLKWADGIGDKNFILPKNAQ